MREVNLPATVVIPEHLRLLEWNEVPRRGDFVEDGHKGFEPWVGPSGFRADAYVKQIFRRLKPPLAKARKSELT